MFKLYHYYNYTKYLYRNKYINIHIMKFIIIGCGGRENIICKRLYDENNTIYCIGEYINPDIKSICKDYFVSSLNDHINILKICDSIVPDIVFIGPENILQSNFINTCKLKNYNCIGPYKELAQLETSKSFTRYLLKEIYKDKYNPKFIYIKDSHNINDIVSFVINNDNIDIVIKSDSLAGGKGVFVQGDHFNTINQGIDIINTKLKDKNILIEEKLVGNEFSLFTLSDGKHFFHLPPVQDYKRAYDNNIGPNTGGMGSIMDNFDFITDEDINECEMLNSTVLLSMNHKYNKPYIGILYGSYMKTTDEQIKLIEYNCRFGDSEVFNIINSIKSSLTDIFTNMVNQTLHKTNINVEKTSNIVKYLVPKGYPDNPVKNKIVYNKINNVYLASIDENYMMLGSRSIAVYADGINLKEAYINCENIINQINTENLFWRKDIGYQKENQQLTYKSSGVDIDKGNEFVKKIKNDVESTYNSNVLGKHGNFGGQYSFKNNVLVASTDGVGTKGSLIKKYTDNYYICGHDIVNHSVNDILVQGAKPLFFLDYVASSNLNIDDTASFVKGCCDACKKVDCVLIGGETAEMPQVYNEGHMDMVGTIVGEKVIDIDIMTENDIAIYYPSSGPHTNGYTLIRKILENNIPPKSVMEDLLQPHRSYLNEVIEINKKYNLSGMCHITGGGLTDNLKRIIPSYLSINLENITYPNWCNWLQTNGNLTNDEMKKTFNCGIGYINFIKPINRDLPLRIGIMGSTKGTILDYIIPEINNPSSLLYKRIEIVKIISNKKYSGILDKGKKYNIKNKYINMLNYLDSSDETSSDSSDSSSNENIQMKKDNYYKQISAEFIEEKVDYILCIGWMSICPPSFIKQWENRCFNIHPSLLPKYGGKMNLNVHKEVIQSKDTETGCTVHIMTDDVDKGGIIVQKKCNVISNDTPETLKERVQKLEGECYIETLYYLYNDILDIKNNSKILGIIRKKVK